MDPEWKAKALDPEGRTNKFPYLEEAGSYPARYQILKLKSSICTEESRVEKHNPLQPPQAQADSYHRSSPSASLNAFKFSNPSHASRTSPFTHPLPLLTSPSSLGESTHHTAFLPGPASRPRQADTRPSSLRATAPPRSLPSLLTFPPVAHVPSYCPLHSLAHAPSFARPYGPQHITKPVAGSPIDQARLGSCDPCTSHRSRPDSD